MTSYQKKCRINILISAIKIYYVDMTADTVQSKSIILFKTKRSYCNLTTKNRINILIKPIQIYFDIAAITTQPNVIIMNVLKSKHS